MKLPLPQLLIIFYMLLAPLNIFSQFKLAGEELDKAKISFNKSNELSNEGFYDQSLDQGLKTLEHFSKVENALTPQELENLSYMVNPRKAHALNSVGIIYHKVFDLSSAKNFYEEAKMLYVKQGYKKDLALTNSNIALINRHEGKLQEALKNQKKSNELFKELINKHTSVSDSIYFFGHNLFFLGQLNVLLDKEVEKNTLQMEEAILFMENHLDAKIEGDSFKYKYAMICLNAIKLGIEENVFEDNVLQKYLDQSIAIYKNSNRNKHTILGQLYALKARVEFRNGNNNLADIEMYLEESRKILANQEKFKNKNEPIKVKDLGMKEKRDLISFFSHRMTLYYEIFEKLNSVDHLKMAYDDILNAELLIDDILSNYSDDANLEVLMNEFSSLHQVGALVLAKYYELTRDPKILDDLFYISEKQKSYILRKAVNRKELYTDLDITKQQILSEGDSLLKSLKVIDFSYSFLQEFGEQENQLAYLKKRRQVKDNYDKWLDKLKNEEQALFNLLHGNKVVSKAEIKKKIKKDKAAILEFIVTKDKIISFLITPYFDTIFVKDLIPEVDRTIKQYYESLIFFKSKGEDYRKTAYKAYSFLFKEVGEILKTQNVKRVYLVPDGILHTVSFNAMLTNKKSKGSYTGLSYLLYDFEFSRHFSASSITKTSAIPNPTKEMVFGGFVSNYKSFPNDLSSCGDMVELKGDSANMELIKRNFKKGEIFHSATLEDFNKNIHKYNIIHFSMHGCVDTLNSNHSSLIFTYENDQRPNELKLGTVYNKTITADLAFLGACDTGLGNLRTGEGLISLNRAFLYAGTKCVISSLWEMNTNEGLGIIRSFYHNLVQEKMRKDEALTLALREYARSQPKHPSNWAHFMITGDLSPLEMMKE